MRNIFSINKNQLC